MTVHPPIEAAPQIRADLRQLRQQRWRALVVYLAVLALFAGALLVRPAPGPAGARDLGWTIGLAALFFGAAASTALAIGVPLLHGRRLWVALGAGSAVMAGGLAAALDLEGSAWGRHGHVCFAFGTAVSALFMLILGALSGRLWRRFPDPAALIALGTTAVGMVALHLRCESTHVLHVLGFHVTPLAVLFLGARALTRLRLSLLDARMDSRPS